MKTDASRLEDIEIRLAKLEKTYLGITDYHKGEIRLIEEEGTNSVLEYLKDKYRGFLVFKPSRDYIKRVRKPKLESEITEFDGIIILSNDPKDIRSDLLNLYITEDKLQNKLYENELRKTIIEIDEKLELYSQIVISNFLSPNVLQNPKTLKNTKKHLESELDRLKNTITVSPDPNYKYTRIFVIVETKHKVIATDVENKLQQLIEIKDVIHNARLYYEVANPVKDYNKAYKRLSKQLRRKTLNLKEFNTRKRELLQNPKYKENIDKKLSDAIIDNDWTDDFMKLCDYENFDFDEVLLFMGGPLWEDDKLKTKLLSEKHGIITQSMNRYVVQTG